MNKTRAIIATLSFILIGVFNNAAQAAQALSPESLVCIRAAARYYHQPTDRVSYEGLVDLVTAVRLAEGGTVGRVSRNKNGSFDIGPMQINSTHLPLLARFGISYDALLNNSCQNIFVGTWILHNELQSTPALWSAIGNYNSRTPSFNVQYQRRIWQKLQRIWADRLSGGALAEVARRD